MKKITKSFFAISLSTAIIFQNMAVISNGEEIKTIQTSQNNSSNYTYLESMNSKSELTTEKDIFIDPLQNNINRPGNENFSQINSIDLRSTTLTASKPFLYPEVNILGKVTVDSLNVRELPSSSANVLSALKKGSIVQILSKENDWYKISYFYRQQVSSSKYDIVFKEAYVSAKYISTLSVKEKGIDVSKWNGTVDWDRVKASGIDYVIIRAGLGTDTIDSMFNSHIEGAIKAGLKIGVYWFSYASSPEKAKIEAQKCLEVIEPYKNNISYPVFFDFEQSSETWVKNNYNITVTEELGTSMAQTFMDTVKSQGYTPGIYAGISTEKYFSDNLLNSSYTWLAQYSYRTSYSKQFSMWQYCEDGYIDGVSGKVDINYTLGSEPLVPVEPEKENIYSALVDNIGEMTYTGSQIKPSVKVSKNGNILKENTDYTITYSNNISVGDGQIIITGIGNYTGTKTVTFKIVPQKLTDNDVLVDNIEEMTYTGSQIKPSVKVSKNGKLLKENTDYTVIYSNNILVGTGKVTITGKGNYTGTKIVYFKIVSQKLTDKDVLVDSIGDITYTGSQIKPSVKVRKNGKLLKENTDYTVTYSNNILVGTGKVTITGKGNYTGTKIVYFKIVSQKLTDKDVLVDSIGDMTYTGSQIKPSVKVRKNGKLLKANTDYNVTYSNNILVGTGKVTIKGKGNYTGTKTATFKIVPQKPSKVSLSKKTTNSITLSWSKINNVTGYKIYKYDSKSKTYKLLTTIANKSTTSYTDKNLNSASSYSYKVRGYYKDSSGNYYYGKYSDIFTESTKVNTVKNLKLSSNTDTSLKISWSKVSNADGYMVYRLNTKTNKYELVKTIKNNSTTSYTDSKRESAETYYYRVKSYKNLNGINQYSDYSSILKATTKPVKPNLSLSSTTSKTIKTSWTNTSKKTTGYEIKMTTSKNGTYKSIGTTKNKSYTKRSLTKSKTYYFKVRAYRTVDGKKIYSSYSSVKSIKCK